MGEVVGAGLLSHVPTIMLPLETRLELNEGKEISLVPALHQIRAEKFELLDYDTVILGTLPANALGTADFPLAVPNAPSLRHLVLWWRGLDVSVAPWQASPVFVTVVQ